MKAYDNPEWIEYILAIKKEESMPKSYIILMEEFLKSLLISLLPNKTPSMQFTDRSIIGYTKNIVFNCSYALAVEVEADYQIYIVAEFVKQHYGESKIKDNIWIDTHLASNGEEEHAKMTTCLAEKYIKSAEDFEELYLGFTQACKDTESFMNDIYDMLYAPNSEFYDRNKT